MEGAGTGGMISQGVQNLHNRYSADRSYNFQRQQHADQLHYSDTTYRRAMADMQAAGLNPMLAAKIGGAPMPSPVGAPPQPAQGPNAVLTGMQVSSAQAGIELQKAQAENVRADTLGKLQIPELLRAQTMTQGANKDQLEAQRDKLMYEIKELLPIQRQQAILSGRLDVTKADLNKYELQHILPLMRELKTIERALGLLSVPRHHADAMASRTAYGQGIRPYLGDLSTMINSAAAGIGGAAGVKYLLGGPGKESTSITFGKGKKYRHE